MEYLYVFNELLVRFCVIEESILYRHCNPSLIADFRENRWVEGKFTLPAEVLFTMGRGFNESHRGRFSYQHFMNDLPNAQEVYIISYGIPEKPLTSPNIIRTVRDLNVENDWDGPMLGVVSGFRSFGDFSHSTADLVCDDESDKARDRYLCSRIEKELTGEQRECIHMFNEVNTSPAGFHFYPNLHAKVYFSDRLVYIGSSNLNAGTLGNAESGITTRNKKVFELVCSFYLALVDEGSFLRYIKPEWM